MITDGSYTQSICRPYPALFIILLDQSKSMDEQVLNQRRSKAEIATTVLNLLINEMIDRAGYDMDGNLKKNAYLSILGYNSIVYPLLSSTDDPIDLPYLDEHPQGIAEIVRNIPDTSTGTFHEIKQEYPYWIEPRATGRTHMAEAFVRAEKIALRWIQSKPELGQENREECFPPIIINITDAQYNDGGNPIGICQRIQRSGTRDGKILIFNCHFTKDMSQPSMFPNNVYQLQHLDPLASQMFEMSSVIPESLQEDASEVAYGQNVLPSARCLVYNADADVLIKFLRFGTVRRTSNTAR